MEWKIENCELGTMLIDWENRKLTIQGIDGSYRGMTPEDILAFLKNDNTEDTERFAIVYWHEPTQFCLYGRDEFVNEVGAARSKGK